LLWAGFGKPPLSGTWLRGQLSATASSNWYGTCVRRKMQLEPDALIARVLPHSLIDPEMLEVIRCCLLTIPEVHAGLGLADYFAAAGVAIIVGLSTFPVVIPFMVLSDVRVALQGAHGTLFLGGWIFGRCAHGNPCRAGFTMAAVGAVLLVATIELGG
jgi:hypothetical protein